MHNNMLITSTLHFLFAFLYIYRLDPIQRQAGLCVLPKTAPVFRV